MTSPPAVERRGQIVRTALSGVLSKVAAFLPTLGIAPLAVSHLGTERFGVLMTILSLMAFLSIADFGIGGSLVTGISRALGAHNLRRVRLLQANGLAATSVIASLLSLAAVGLATSNVGTLLFPHSVVQVRDEATHALSLFTLLFAIGLPMTLVAKIQLGMQRGHIANHWQTLAGLLNFAGGLVACRLGAGVVGIIAGLTGGTLLCGLANSLMHFRSAASLHPKWKDLRKPVLGHVLRDSTFYLALQLIFVATYAVDTLIVANKLGAQEASSYALAERLFGVVAVAVSVVAGPLWAAFGAALGSGDHAWARRSLTLSLWRTAAIGTVISGALAILFNPLVELFGSGALHVPLKIALAMAVWRVVEAVGSMMGLYLFSSHAVRVVVITGFFTSMVSLTLKVHWVEPFGAVALPITTTACSLLLSLLPCMLYIRYMHSQPTSKDRTWPR